MVKKLPESQDNILGYEATGRLHDEDYKKVFIPDIEKAVEKYGKMRCLLYMPEEFKGWTPKAFWDDFKIGVGKYKNDYEKIAVVGGPGWVRLGMEIDEHFAKGKAKVFEVDQLEEAWKWIKE